MLLPEDVSAPKLNYRDADSPMMYQHHAKVVHEQKLGYLNLPTWAIFMQLLGEAKTPLNHDWHLASAQQWAATMPTLIYSAVPLPQPPSMALSACISSCEACTTERHRKSTGGLSRHALTLLPLR